MSENAKAYRWHVCPPDAWNIGVDYVIETLKKHGMTPTSRVLDVGCGCLRIGQHLIRFLNTGGYAGVEPCVPILAAGMFHEVGVPLLNEKNPVFLFTDKFDFLPADYPFTHVVAIDVFIHCGIAQFEQFLWQVKKVITKASHVIVTVNVGENCYGQPKRVDSNTLSDKAATGHYCYEHAKNAVTVFTAATLHSLIEKEGMTCRVHAEFGSPDRPWKKWVLDIKKGVTR